MGSCGIRVLFGGVGGGGGGELRGMGGDSEEKEGVL